MLFPFSNQTQNSHYHQLLQNSRKIKRGYNSGICFIGSAFKRTFTKYSVTFVSLRSSTNIILNYLLHTISLLGTQLFSSMWSISQSSFVAMGVCQHSYGESIYSTRHQYCYSYTYILSCLSTIQKTYNILYIH